MIKSGRWIASSGSYISLEVNGDNLSGYYSTARGEPTGQEKFPITGFVNNNLIGFVCSWKDYHSITSWCGRHYLEDDGHECIKTIWHLGRKYNDLKQEVEADIWNSFLTYTETYYLQKNDQ